MTTIIEDIKLDFQDVLLLPKRSVLSSRAEVSIARTMKFRHCTKQFHGVPILAANMDTVGTIQMAKRFYVHQMGVALHKFYSVDDLVDFFSSKESVYSFYTMGISEVDYEKFVQVQMRLPSSVRPIMNVCIDVANGYSRKFVDFVETLRERHPSILIMAGNVVTPDMVYDLLQRGADIVKVGIGSGSVCTTRKITGVGYPQLSAVIECADAAHGAGGHICSDGGITCPGDVVKAFAGGADFVMCGGLFAGHNETVLDDVLHDTVKFYGMSSEEAMNKHYGGKADYRAGEGKVVELPNKGPVTKTVEEILGGLRSACTYVGATQLKHLPKCATFVRVNRILNSSMNQYEVQ